MPQRLIDLYRADLADQTTTETRQTCRRYWYRAVGVTIMERSLSPIPIPKRGTHGVRVEMFRPFWRYVADEELDALFLILAPYFKTAQRLGDDLT